MPVTVVCPACKAKLKAPDTLIGKTVKCPGCTKPVVVKAAAPTQTPAPAVKKPVKQPAPPVLEEAEPLDDMEEELDEPKLKKNKKKRVVEEEEPIEDVMDDEEEEEEVEARPKKKKRKNGGSTDSERSTASFIHFGTLINMIFAPFGYIVPIVLWMMKRKESAFIDHHGKTWLNFHISMFVLYLGMLVVLGGLAAVGYYLSGWITALFVILLVLSSMALSIYMLVMYLVAGS